MLPPMRASGNGFSKTLQNLQQKTCKRERGLGKTQPGAEKREAKQLEVSQWVSKKVCERFRGAVPAGRLMKTRWVLVFKAVDRDESKVKCKARIVLLCFTDPDLGELETCAPTLSRRSRHWSATCPRTGAGSRSRRTPNPPSCRVDKLNDQGRYLSNRLQS